MDVLSGPIHEYPVPRVKTQVTTKRVRTAADGGAANAPSALARMGLAVSSFLKVGDVSLIHSGSDARFLLLGGRFVSGETLLRFYVLHCVAIPLAAALLIAVHFWRVRKDGGISGPM